MDSLPISWYNKISCVLKEPEAHKADMKSTYVILSRRYDNGNVTLTTLDPANRNSKRVTSSEVDNLQKWLLGDPHTVFEAINSGLYVHQSKSRPSFVHFRNKINNDFVFTYVPKAFLEKL